MYNSIGGLDRFALDYRNRTLPKEALPLLKTTLAKISNTIVAGPVTYAGGALETGRVFRYDPRKREVVMDAGIWREMSLLGHWIQDAVILRWAELTADISRKRVKPSEVIDLLLMTPTDERNVTDARQIFEHLPSKTCAWTGKSIQGKFQVDHIIPFSLWHSNDLWNLVPVLPAINLKKSDRLPTRDLLLSRKDCIIGYWETMHSTLKERFEHEACRLLGKEMMPPNWHLPVFSSVAEAVEITAIQRGCERWQP